MLTPEQLADLRAKAKCVLPHRYPDALCYGSDRPYWQLVKRKEDIDFINAANPATVLQLLDMVERLEKEAYWLAEYIVIHSPIPHDIEDRPGLIRKWLKTARKMVEEAESER